MSSFFQKSLTLIVQIALVVAVVLVFAWYDPFDMFGSVKTKLKNTPVQVESIQKIGKLITAEYYGETMASLNEVIDEELQIADTNFNEEIEQIHEDFKAYIKDLQDYSKKNLGKRTELRAFQDSFPSFFEYSLAEIYLNYTFCKLSAFQNFTVKDFENDLSQKQKEKLFKKLRNSKDWKNNFNTLDTYNLQTLFKSTEAKKSYKKYRKARLVIIGKGWIKAGIDFEDFKQRNFRYNEKKNQIYFIGMQPQILSKTMNPWFIPEEGVEGFEFVMAEKGGLYNPEFVQKVKAKCLEKLESQAIQKQILVQAKTNAENQLQSFFELLLGKKLNKVVIYSNYLEYTLNALPDTLNNEAIELVDTALLYYREAQMDSTTQPDETLDAFNKTIKGKSYFLHNVSLPIHARSSYLYELLKDFKIDVKDSLLLAEIDSNSIGDSLFYHELLDQPELFTERLDVAKKQFYVNLQTYLKSQKEFPHSSLDSLKKYSTDELPQALNKLAVSPKN